MIKYVVIAAVLSLAIFMVLISLDRKPAVSLETPSPSDVPAADSSALSLETPGKVFIRIFKEEKKLEMWICPEGSNVYQLAQTFPVLAMSGKIGPKLREGDRQAPEGFYATKKSLLNPNSRYHLAFNIGYPNAFDRANNRTGSYIMVHGSNVSVGCFAMGNEGIEKIYKRVELALKNQNEVPIHIFPFVMDTAHMDAQKNNPNYAYWENLKAGYDVFETKKIPPNVGVKNKKYTFSSDAE